MLFNRNRITVLTYHRTIDEPWYEDSLSVKLFEKQIKFLAKHSNVLSVEDIFGFKHSIGGTLITFDDGYIDNVDVALPILQKYGVKACFFLTSTGIEEGVLWVDKIIQIIKCCSESSIKIKIGSEFVFDVSKDVNKHVVINKIISLLKYETLHYRELIIGELQRKYGPKAYKRVLLDKNNVKQLIDAGMEIGGHTRAHPILIQETEALAKKEIELNKAYLESEFDLSLRFFAYPNGKIGKDYDKRHIEMVKNCGYKFAFSTDFGDVNKSTLINAPHSLMRKPPNKGSFCKFIINNIF